MNRVEEGVKGKIRDAVVKEMYMEILPLTRQTIKMRVLMAGVILLKLVISMDLAIIKIHHN